MQSYFYTSWHLLLLCVDLIWIKKFWPGFGIKQQLRLLRYAMISIPVGATLWTLVLYCMFFFHVTYGTTRAWIDYCIYVEKEYFLPHGLALVPRLNLHHYQIKLPRDFFYVGVAQTGVWDVSKLWKYAQAPMTLKNRHLAFANFDSAIMPKVNFYGAVLVGASLTDANFEEANLDNANLQGADLANANLKQAQLNDALLQSAHLNEVQLQGAQLNRAQLQGVDMLPSWLRGWPDDRVKSLDAEANLEGADLQYANLQGANLMFANLKGVNLSNARLHGANLSGAELNGSNLGNANLQSTFLNTANLQGAFLEKAQFQGANLYKTTLRGAQVERLKLHGIEMPPVEELSKTEGAIDWQTEMDPNSERRKQEISNLPKWLRPSIEARICQVQVNSASFVAPELGAQNIQQFKTAWLEASCERKLVPLDLVGEEKHRPQSVTEKERTDWLNEKCKDIPPPPKPK